MQCPRSRMTKRMPNETAQNKAALAYTTSPFYFVSRLLFRYDALSYNTTGHRVIELNYRQGWMICCLQLNHGEEIMRP
jgi:hypothetical protein